MADAPASTAAEGMAALRAAYLSGLPAKLEKIGTAASGLEPDSPIDEARAALGKLHRLAHKLVGSAGTYGFSNLSQIARDLELSCLALVESGPEVSAQRRKEIDLLITLLQEAGKAAADVAMREPSPGLEETAPRGVTGDTVILVEDDETQAGLLKMLLSNFGFDVRALSHPSALRQAIADSPPAAIIMDIIFPGDPDAGTDTVRALRDEGVLPCPVIFLSIRDDFPARLEAARGGSDGYVVKPVDIIDLVDTLTGLIARPRIVPPHILIVEDDAETAASYSELLVGAGMTTEVVTDPMRATEALLRHVADVILLDINMPGCDGLELASVVRQMGVEYRHIPIVFLTAKLDADQRAIAIRRGGDDFVSKPVDPAFLVSSVLARAERWQRMKALISGPLAGRERFRSVAETASDAIITSDERGLITSWNASAQRIFGYGKDSVLGWPLTKLMPERYREAHRKGLARVVAGGRPRLLGETSEFMGLHQNGSEIPLELSLSRWSSMGRANFTAIMRDITARKEAEQALRNAHELLERRVQERTAELGESEARLRAIMDNSPNAFHLKDLEGRYRVINRRFEEWHGLSADNVLGKTSNEVFPEDRAEQHVGIDRQVRETGKVVHYEYRVPHANGDERRMAVTNFPVYDAAGEYLGVGGITSDVTEQRLAEEQLRQAQKLQSLGELTGGVAHDFNNLLAVVLGHAELLQERLGIDDISLGAIERAASRGAELTQRLLGFSRKQALQPKPIDLHGLVVGMMDMLRRTLGETIELESSCDADLWTAMADPGQVENAILNFAINARDAMPDGGELAIDCGNVSLDSEFATRFADGTPGDFVMLKVSDTGCGMSPEVRDRVFEPFFTTKDVGEGTGLGLSMVYGFAKQSGGLVTIESQIAHGTTVTLYLPRTDARAQAAPEATTEDLPEARGETILVIEDEPGVRALAAGMLESVGYRVLEAADGEAAIAAMEKASRIDLLLSDVVLPGGMSGPESAAEARRRYPAIKVLYMSGYADSTIHHRQFKDTDLIDKPFRKRDLVRKVRAILG